MPRAINQGGGGEGESEPPHGPRSTPSRTSQETVSKPRFWGILALQPIDFLRPHFQKIEFSHSLAVEPTPNSLRSCLALSKLSFHSGARKNARILLVNPKVPKIVLRICRR